MTRTTRRFALSALVCSTIGLMIAAGPAQHARDGQDGDRADVRSPIAPSGLIAVIYPTEGNKAKGIVRFEQRGDSVRVTARIAGLKPGSENGFHVHEFGDASAPDGTSAGDHFNPEGHEHGLPPDSQRHTGAFGNLKANAQGVANLTLTVEDMALA